MSWTEHARKLHLCSLTAEQRSRTCGYWYVVTADGFSHTAFRTRSALLRWMELRGLAPTAEIPESGEWSAQWLTGEYRHTAHMEARALDYLEGTRTRTLSNGDWVEAVIVTDSDGVRNVHTLNPNVRERRTFDYRESQAIEDGGAL